ncbi:MAG: molecular chaperone Hsc20 [Chromatiaceae bacterium]|nr:molecular chaperone Hsc20 [Chromatiaceae bacterium]
MLDAAKNHFELFGLPPSFSLDRRQLAERYRLLVSAARAEGLGADADPEGTPDTPTLQRIEEAYQVLLDPLARAKYLLALHGEEISETEDNGGARLIDQMELRESLDEASSRSAPDMAVAKVLTELAEQGASLSKELHALLADPTPENLSAARDIVAQLDFLARCRRDAEQRRAVRAP